MKITTYYLNYVKSPSPYVNRDVLIVDNFNIVCLILVGMFCNSFNYYFQLITASFHTK